MSVVPLRPEGCTDEAFDEFALAAAKLRIDMPATLTGVDIEQVDDGVVVKATDNSGERHQRHFGFDELRN